MELVRDVVLVSVFLLEAQAELVVMVKIGRDEAKVSFTKPTISDIVFHSFLRFHLIMLASCR